MSNKTHVRLGWGTQVVIDIKDLPTLLSILENAPILESGYLDGENGFTPVSFWKEKGYHLEYGPLPKEPVMEEAEYWAAKKQEEENKEASNDEAA